MQYNKALPTIEKALRDAIAAAGGIAPANVGDDFSKIGWSRAARTDRGVSAVGQVVALRLLCEDEEADPVQAINAALPPAIRILGCARVTASFDARKACDRRRYEYLLPAWALDPAAGVARNDAKKEAAKAAGTDAADGVSPPATQDDGGAGAPAGAPPLPAPASPFVFDEAARERVSSILAAFQGTHNFHNFTVRMPGTDPTAKRYIISFTCEGTVDIGGAHWVRLVVVGQSFILHQIRKMVGTALAVARGVAPPGAIPAALRAGTDVTTPLAPDTGLFLDESVFHTYNRRWGEGRGERLELARFGGAADAFKREAVYPHIAAREAADGTMAEFLRGLNDRNFRFSSWETAGLRAAAGGGQGKRGRGPALGEVGAMPPPVPVEVKKFKAPMPVAAMPVPMAAPVVVAAPAPAVAAVPAAAWDPEYSE
jgi:tRNA pseudouridine38-40 synthase